MPPFAWLRLVLAVAVITPAASLASVPALTHARPVSLRGGVSLCAVVQPSPPPVAPAGVKPPLVTSRRARIADAATAALCGGQPVAAIAALFALNELVRVGLLAAGLAIPSSLVAMLVVFATLCLLSAAIPSVADAVAGFFAPGAGMLNRWLATFYVPSLLAFPVTAPDLAPLQIAGCVGLCVLLLLANIAATATACQWLGESESASSTSVGPTEPAAPPATAPTPPVSKTPEPAAPTVRPPAPADVKLGLSALLFGLAAALGSASGFGIGGAAAAGGSGLALSTRLAIDAFITAAMFGGLCAASRLPRWLAAAVHPIFVSTGAAAAAVAALAAAGVGAPMAVLRAYLYEPALRTAGGAPLVGGGALTALLGPTVVSFGLQMHGYRGLMVTRAKQVFGSLFVSTTFGLATSILAARLLRLSPALRLALLPRAVTTPLALEMSRLLSADPAIVILTVFTTGLVVVTLGPLILKRLRCTDPVARGIALGATAHGGGVLALAGEKQAFPFAAMAMALNGAASVMLLCIPAARRFILMAALG